MPDDDPYGYDGVHRGHNQGGTECLGWQERIGTVEAGKLADIVVAGVDPLKDVRALENVDNIKVVIQDGMVLKASR